jgi:ribonuclease D
MTPGQIRRYGEGLLAAVRRGQAGPHPRPPRYPREPDAVRERYDRLHKWRKEMGKARGVESDVILPREALWELARRAPRSADELRSLQHLGPWRREQYGAVLLKLLNAANGRE